jgi:hypothetical protein
MPPTLEYRRGLSEKFDRGSHTRASIILDEERGDVEEVTSWPTYNPKTSVYFWNPTLTDPNPEMTTSHKLLEGGANWKGVGTSRVRAVEATQRLLEHFYILRDSSKISQFLKKDALLLRWIVPLYFGIREIFPNHKIALELVKDPEVEDDKLVAFVLTNLTPATVLEKLEEFDESWWAKKPKRLEEKLSVTAEFYEL